MGAGLLDGAAGGDGVVRRDETVVSSPEPGAGDFFPLPRFGVMSAKSCG